MRRSGSGQINEIASRRSREACRVRFVVVVAAANLNSTGARTIIVGTFCGVKRRDREWEAEGSPPAPPQRSPDGNMVGF